MKKREVDYDYPSLRRIQKLASFVKGKRVLDIGCRDAILRRYLSADVDYYGLDKLSYSKVAKSSRVFTTDICARALPRQLKRSYFETVVLGETLEHLKNPLKALQNINKLLINGGRLVGSTPNILSWRFFFFFELIHGKKGKKIPEENDHLYSFDKGTLKNLLLLAGFKIKMIKEWGNWIPHTCFFLPFNFRGNHLIFIAEK